MNTFKTTPPEEIPNQSNPPPWNDTLHSNITPDNNKIDVKQRLDMLDKMFGRFGFYYSFKYTFKARMERYLENYHAKIRWSHLRRLGQSKLVQTTFIWIIFVPILAKSTSRINDLVTFNAFGMNFILDLKLPFSWIAFYFAALSFTVASVLYAKYCPILIREYASLFTFQSQGRMGGMGGQSVNLGGMGGQSVNLGVKYLLWGVSP